MTSVHLSVPLGEKSVDELYVHPVVLVHRHLHAEIGIAVRRDIVFKGAGRPGIRLPAELSPEGNILSRSAVIEKLRHRVVRRRGRSFPRHRRDTVIAARQDKAVGVAFGKRFRSGDQLELQIIAFESHKFIRERHLYALFRHRRLGHGRAHQHFLPFAVVIIDGVIGRFRRHVCVGVPFRLFEDFKVREVDLVLRRNQTVARRLAFHRPRACENRAGTQRSRQQHRRQQRQKFFVSHLVSPFILYGSHPFSFNIHRRGTPYRALSARSAR